MLENPHGTKGDHQQSVTEEPCQIAMKAVGALAYAAAYNQNLPMISS